MLKTEARPSMRLQTLVFAVLILPVCLLTVTATSSADDTSTLSAQQFDAQLAIALKGDAEGQYRVGEMHEKGIGTPRDPAKAYLWFSKAAKQDHRQAKEKLAALDEKNRAANIEEQIRVENTVRALQRQAEQEAAAQRAKEKAAEARTRQQAEEAAARAKSAEAAARSKAVAATAAPTAPASVIAPLPVAPKPSAPNVQTVAPVKPVPVTEKEPAEFSTNPCKGPQAKFLSTCN